MVSRLCLIDLRLRLPMRYLRIGRVLHRVAQQGRSRRDALAETLPQRRSRRDALAETLSQGRSRRGALAETLSQRRSRRGIDYLMTRNTISIHWQSMYPILRRKLMTTRVGMRQQARDQSSSGESRVCGRTPVQRCIQHRGSSQYQSAYALLPLANTF